MKVRPNVAAFQVLQRSALCTLDRLRRTDSDRISASPEQTRGSAMRIHRDVAFKEKIRQSDPQSIKGRSQ
jgi:hypothetical protein